MTDQSVAPRRTTRHHRCDEHFLELLEEDFGIRQFYLIRSFMGVPAEPKKQAIALCEWATRKAADVEEAGEILLKWARKNKRGEYRPGMADVSPPTYEQNEHLRSIGRLA